MRKVFLAVVATTFMWACSKEENPPEPSDLNPRGVIEPLENETDPNKIENWFTKGPTEKLKVSTLSAPIKILI
jgi:hypothetical protein